MEQITIPKQEYDYLLRIKMAVESFDQMLHQENETMLKVAEDISQNIKEGKIKLISEEEFFNGKAK